MACTQEEKDIFIHWLRGEYSQRADKNPRYSLRAFAKVVGMDSSSLTQIMAKKRPLSKKKMTEIAEKLGASESDVSSLLNTTRFSQLGDYQVIASDQSEIIGKWYYSALMELTFIDDFKSDARWIAQQLGISVQEVKTAVENLVGAGLLDYRGKKLFKTSKLLTNFSPGKTSLAHKKLQKSVVDMAAEAIDNCPMPEKDITSMTFSINENKLPEAREVIARFRREMAQLLEDGKQTRVYNLGIQLYPVSQKARIEK